ncbi:MAG: DUF4830 domain-containing protein [Oscillospiraceae bacterium]|nr:DUF4830 domain-containing protein [Oscillospiraceae bacterium]MBP3319292.1 DUF4830 domain-containing protein [Ruminiclostridium sp.]MBP3520486.1 DUF4830 domain-containing protein [Oscillospiraceae bacterium]
MDVFIWTAKIHKRKLAAVLAAVVVAGAALAVAMTAISRPASAAAEPDPKGVRSAEDRVAYLESWGLQVSPEAVLVEELAMPEEFGTEYEQYLALQSSQGFDLSKYAGKRVKRYTYQVLNHPNGGEVTAHLLLCKNTVVGGELMGTDFLCGLGGT